jgi:hypothetical protein
VDDDGGGGGGGGGEEESKRPSELRFYSQCKYPSSCGQALEELEFFKVGAEQIKTLVY